MEGNAWCKQWEMLADTNKICLGGVLWVALRWHVKLQSVAAVRLLGSGCFRAKHRHQSGPALGPPGAMQPAGPLAR
jgi:hypothetical protein